MTIFILLIYCHFANNAAAIQDFVACLTLFLHVASTISTLKVVVTEKKGTCLKLREQLEALEKEAAAKLTEVDAYNRDMQVGIKCIVTFLTWHQTRCLISSNN